MSKEDMKKLHADFLAREAGASDSYFGGGKYAPAGAPDSYKEGFHSGTRLKAKHRQTEAQKINAEANFMEEARLAKKQASQNLLKEQVYKAETAMQTPRKGYTNLHDKLARKQ